MSLAPRAPHASPAGGAQQNTASTRIAAVSDVSKAFYDVLLSQRQLDVFNEDIRRLQRNYQDARSPLRRGHCRQDRLPAGRNFAEQLAGGPQAGPGKHQGQTAYLQQLMGLPPTAPWRCNTTRWRWKPKPCCDTTAPLDPASRIETSSC